MYPQPSLHRSASDHSLNNRVTPPASPVASDNGRRTRISIHDILDSTTLEIGFDQTCLEGLTDDLLYSPIDAFTQSCWEILFPEPQSPPKPKLQTQPSQRPQQHVQQQQVHQKTTMVDFDPPLYTPFPEIYTIPEASSSHSTIRQGDAESSIRFVSTACFWDDSDDEDVCDADDADDEAELEDEASSFADDESEEGSSLGLSHNDAIKDHPIIDMNFAVMDDLFLPDFSVADWKSAFVSWESSLPVSVDFRETPVTNKVQKPSRMAALRAKIPILPFARSNTTVDNPWL